MATSIAGGALASRKCNPKMPGASSFSKTGRYRVPSTLARRQQFFVAAQRTGTSPERTMDGCCHYHFKSSLKLEVSVGARGSSADPARTSTEGAAPTTPPGGVIDRIRHGSIVGSVGPLHGPGRQRSHASAPGDSLPPPLGPPGRNPSGERACEWTSGRAGVTRTKLCVQSDRRVPNQ